jgi:exosortase A-associated hydrolase 2
MKETPFFFPGDAGALFGILHEPPSYTDRPAFVFCHPFGEEKLWSHRACVSFARALAERGHAVLRFDLRGNGDSEGAFADATVTTSIRDTACAIDQAKARTGAAAVSLLGLRLGAAVAALTAETRTDVRHLIQWAPVVDGGRFAQELLRINLATQMALYKEVREDRAALVARMRTGETINVDGYPMSEVCYDALGALKLAAATRSFGGPCLVVQVDKVAGAPQPELDRLRGCYEHATLVVVQEDPFWKEIDRFYYEAPNLAAATLAWLEQQ